jgi:quercetin dioxygenase-like cupin family protein
LGQKGDHLEKTGIQYRRQNVAASAFLVSGFAKKVLLFEVKFIRPNRILASNIRIIRQNMKMTQHLRLLRLLSSLSLWLIPAVLSAREPQIEVQQILQTTQSWDGNNYAAYPTGQPQLTVLRIKVPPNTALHWHHHPVISVGYVLSGELTLEKKATGERTIVHAGQALAETVQTTHRGFTTNEPVELVVFYAGQIGVPITVNEE